MSNFDFIEDKPSGPEGDRLVSTDCAHQHQAEFRVVTHEGARHGFRLEQIFWSLLEGAAASKGLRIGAHIADILSASPGDSNSSSTLRVNAAQWVSQRLKDTLGKTLTPRFVLGVVRASPLPCFVMDNSNRIAVQNDAFMVLLRAQLGDWAGPDATIHIRFRSDIAAIRARLKARQDSFVEDVVHIGTPKRDAAAQARIAGIESPAGGFLGLLVYVSSQSRAPSERDQC